MSLINPRNTRLLLHNFINSSSARTALKNTASTMAVNTVSLASNQAINKAVNTIADGTQDLVKSALSVPGTLVTEIINGNSVHETTGAFNYNPNNGQNYNYNLANEYMNLYKSYVQAKSYINQSQSNLASQMYQKELNSYNASFSTYRHK